MEPNKQNTNGLRYRQNSFVRSFSLAGTYFRLKSKAGWYYGPVSSTGILKKMWVNNNSLSNTKFKAPFSFTIPLTHCFGSLLHIVFNICTIWFAKRRSFVIRKSNALDMYFFKNLNDNLSKRFFYKNVLCLIQSNYQCPVHIQSVLLQEEDLGIKAFSICPLPLSAIYYQKITLKRL